jgi:hypothetical protein
MRPEIRTPDQGELKRVVCRRCDRSSDWKETWDEAVKAWNTYQPGDNEKEW